MSGGHCTLPTGGPAIRLKHKKLPDARRTKGTLCVGVLHLNLGWEFFVFGRGLFVRMDVIVKPKCYESAPSCVFRPSIKCTPCTVSSALSSCPSCSAAESMCGLANVDVPKFLSLPCLDFADLFSPCFAPACDPVPPVSSACSDAAPSSTVAAPPGFVQSWPVVSSCSVSSVASRSRLAFVPPSPPGSFRFVPSCPLISFAQPLRPAFVQPCVPFGASPFCRPFFPMACFVLVVVPILFSTPFGFVLSFLPVLR